MMHMLPDSEFACVCSLQPFAEVLLATKQHLTKTHSKTYIAGPDTILIARIFTVRVLKALPAEHGASYMQVR